MKIMISNHVIVPTIYAVEMKIFLKSKEILPYNIVYCMFNHYLN